MLARLAAEHEVAFLLTRPDARRGRGRKLAPPPAKDVAERLGIAVLQPERPADAELPDTDAIVVAAYGLLVPESLLERTLWLNVHPSLLPRWRELPAAPAARIRPREHERDLVLRRQPREHVRSERCRCRDADPHRT